jgi:hypothetical protein
VKETEKEAAHQYQLLQAQKLIDDFHEANRRDAEGVEDLSLSKLDEVLKAIDAATTVQEIKGTLDMAKAAEVYAKQAKLGKDIELKAAEYIVRAERKLGEMLKAAKAAGQITKAHNPKKKPKHDVPDENIIPFTLEEAGIDRKLSSRAQKVAAIPKKEFETKVVELKTSGNLTSKKVVQSAMAQARTKTPKVVSKPHQIAGDNLSATAQQKLDRAIQQHKAKLYEQFDAEVNARVQVFLENTIGPQYEAKLAEAQRIIESRKGIMDLKSFNKIRECLHSDRVLDPKLKPKYDEAFIIFERLKKILLDEKNSPTEFVNLPKTPAEWADLKRQENERRKSKRKQGNKSGSELQE